MIISMYLACAPARHRALFYASWVGIAFLVVGIVDRGIETGVFKQLQFGVAPPPVVSRAAF